MPSLGFQFRAMGSPCEVRVEGGDEARLATAAQRAIDEVRRLELKYSRYRDASIVSRINAAAGSADGVGVDAETAALLDFAAQLHAASDGRFDITSGTLRRAWDFRSGAPPTPQRLAALLPLVGWPLVEWRGGVVRLPQPGMELDFGGFAKEYAADRAAGVLLDDGIAHGFVNLGGDLRVAGPHADGQPWRFGIQHPRREDATIAGVELRSGALATSGDYERYLVHDGRRYCHVLDPRTGWPVEGWASVSVVAPACAAAGALTTIAMLQGDGAVAFLAAQNASYLALDTQLHPRCGGPEATVFHLGDSR